MWKRDLETEIWTAGTVGGRLKWKEEGEERGTMSWERKQEGGTTGRQVLGGATYRSGHSKIAVSVEDYSRPCVFTWNIA